MTSANTSALQSSLASRFSDAPDLAENLDGNDALQAMAARGSCRSFEDRSIAPDLIQTLCAVALASPTKSDLQQRDIIVISDPAKRKQLADLVAGQTWVAKAPMLMVFCGNNRRQRMLHDWHNIPFANDHMDAFFNATVDASIALGAFVTAAEAAGLGCCPISALRNRAQEVSDLLELPDHVFPVAGLALGYPAQAPQISMRLPLAQTVHWDSYDETGLQAAVEAYDAQREAAQPYAQQRYPNAFGESPTYGWSTDKARQYSQPEREGFGDFIRAKGFKLD